MRNDKVDIDWAALVDLFASEYGWTIDYILDNLTFQQALILIKQIKRRNNSSDSYEDSQNPNEEIPLSDFETKLGGKRIVDEDGRTKIVL